MRAYDVIRMLSRGGRSTPLGDAIAPYGRIAMTLHILRLVDEPGYRRQTKMQANLQEGHHALTLARMISMGSRGQLSPRHQDGMGTRSAPWAWSPTPSCSSTRYMDAAVNQLRAGWLRRP